MRSRLGLGLLLALSALFALLAIPAGGEVAQKRDLIVSFGGSISPTKLPRTGTAPMAVNISARVRTTDGSLPPSLSRISLDINRNGTLFDRGLPSCPIERIRSAIARDALTACDDARVGGGRAGGEIDLTGQPPFQFSGRLVAFNGTLGGGRQAILTLLYIAAPIPLDFILPFTIQHTAGTFGTQLVGIVPKRVQRVTHITRLSLRLHRLYKADGQRRSYLSAGCPAPEGFPTATFPLVRASYRFEDDTTLSNVLIRTCHAR